jgi:hypothetical protein
MSHTRLAALAVALLACSTPRSTTAHDYPTRSGPYSLEAVDEAGRPLPTFQHRGRTYVLGTHGARYLLRIRNGTGRRIEVVASVDGRDVIDGKPSSASKPGYLVDAWGEVVIDGFRLSGDAVAAFRFSTVEQSYAAKMGDARDVGVIGAAIFPEAAPAVPYPAPYRPEAGAGRGRDSEAAPAQPSAPSASGMDEGLASRGAEKRERPGLGTGFGEQHESHAVEVAFERASSRPAAVLTARYDDRKGLIALGIDVDGNRVSSRDRWLRDTAEPFRCDRFAEPPPGWNGR